MKRTSNGFTVVELVTVLAIIGLLASVLLLAVQSVRSSSRRLTCQNSMRQCVLAVVNVESAHNCLPSFLYGYRPLPAFGCSALVELLPYLEQPKIDYEAISYPQIRSFQVENKNSVFTCVEDAQEFGTSFRLNVGNNIFHSTLYEDNSIMGGPFDGARRIRFSEITDGLSSTACMSERMRGSGREGGPFEMNVLSAHADLTTSSVAPFPTDDIGIYYNFGGWSFLSGEIIHTGYTHARLPNSEFKDALYCVGPSTQALCMAGLISSRSIHWGTVNVGFLDGGIRPVSDHIDLDVWQALGTRAAGETVALPE